MTVVLITPTDPSTRAGNNAAAFVSYQVNMKRERVACVQVDQLETLVDINYGTQSNGGDGAIEYLSQSTEMESRPNQSWCVLLMLPPAQRAKLFCLWLVEKGTNDDASPWQPVSALTRDRCPLSINLWSPAGIYKLAEAIMYIFLSFCPPTPTIFSLS